MRNRVTLLVALLTVTQIPVGYTEETYCKLTVNGGIGMNGSCTFDSETGEFSDGLLKTACRSGLSECHPDDLEVIRGGVFGRVTPIDGSWEFCWNNGGYTDINECFEGLRKEYSCWIRLHKVVFCID